MARVPTASLGRVRGTRLDLCLSAVQKDLLEHVAMLSGQSLSEFVVASAEEAAHRVMRERATISLTREEQVEFVRALLRPAPPSARLREAAAVYKKARSA